MTDADLLGRLLAGVCELDERLLEDLLAAGLPAEGAARRATRGWWHGGTALLLGSALVLGSAQSVAAHEVTAPATVASRGVGAVASIAASVTGGAAIEAAAQASIARAAIAAETVLLIPELGVEAQQGTQTGQLYTVQPGDTLWSIAQRFYGSGASWQIIYNANANLIADANWIYPGQVLTVPSGPALVGTATPTPGLSGTFTPANSAGQTGQGMGQYTVKPGDSLWSIAQLAYGDPGRWVDIYNANVAIIGADPGLIFSGTVLTIP
ncbi:MAG: LysM peptidoglycan-binding domain-containing protein [Chloroflexales bacterium]|nr:LysM peptidoglycan-binding domain-containing protein [Chloroflexales bacterium]